MSETVLKIENLTFGYENNRVLFKDFSLEVKRGEVVAIVGPSGVGKTTLFELVAGFLKPLKGRIRRGTFSQVFQDPYTSFHPSYSIVNQISDVADLSNLERIASKMSLDISLLDKMPHELSGGQLQRCSILRALLMKPSLLLADEPTSALDNIIQLEVMKTLLEFLDEIGILLITHDIDLARWCSDKIIDLGESGA